MYLVHSQDAIACKQETSCIVQEYRIADEDMNGAFVSIQGRYPSSGYALNLICKEMAYIISGSGRVVVEEKEYPLSQGDVVLLLPGEKYFWDGDMKIFMPCTPAWTPDQYRCLDKNSGEK
jgi:mannose-6-phosphate isomerase-like protein (cupin superfamily)